MKDKEKMRFHNEKQEKEVTDFFKAALIVDGEVKIVPVGSMKITSVIELNDSKRGKFFIGNLE